VKSSRPEYLENLGMRIVERNWRCPDGEIDIVAIDGDTLVIAEVKTRKFARLRTSRLRRWAQTSLPGCTGWRSAWCRDHELGCRSAASTSLPCLTTASANRSVEHLKGVL
jgi:putative endonuclease